MQKLNQNVSVPKLGLSLKFNRLGERYYLHEVSVPLFGAISEIKMGV